MVKCVLWGAMVMRKILMSWVGLFVGCALLLAGCGSEKEHSSIPTHGGSGESKIAEEIDDQPDLIEPAPPGPQCADVDHGLIDCVLSPDLVACAAPEIDSCLVVHRCDPCLLEDPLDCAPMRLPRVCVDHPVLDCRSDVMLPICKDHPNLVCIDYLRTPICGEELLIVGGGADGFREPDRSRNDHGDSSDLCGNSTIDPITLDDQFGLEYPPIYLSTSTSSGNFSNNPALLFYLDQDTGQEVFIAEIINESRFVASVGGFDISPQGDLFVIGQNGRNSPQEYLYRVNILTGEATTIGPLVLAMPDEIAVVLDMAFDRDGRLFALFVTSLGTEVQLYEIDPHTAALSLVGGIGPTGAPILTVAGFSAKGSLFDGFDAAIVSSTVNDLYSIDGTDASSTNISSLTFPADLSMGTNVVRSMDFDPINDRTLVYMANSSSFSEYVGVINIIDAPLGEIEHFNQTPTVVSMRSSLGLGLSIDTRYEQCDGSPPSTGAFCSEDCLLSETNCSDDVDNDLNFASDCADTACSNQPCDDGNICTIGDRCSDGRCTGTPCSNIMLCPGADLTDSDSDQIADCADNCPNIANPDQQDLDNDGVGTLCDCDDANNEQGPITGTARYVDSSSGNDMGDCSLPLSPCDTIAYAITQASAGDTIVLSSGTFNEFDLTIGIELSIQGRGPGTSIIDAGGSGRGFFVQNTADLDLCGFTIQNASIANINGAGIYNEGRLMATNLRITNNHITGTGAGAGIYNNNANTNLDIFTTIKNSTIDVNTIGMSGTGGAGAYNLGVLNVVDSTVQNNVDSSTVGGGGIVNQTINASGGMLKVERSTVSGNSTNGNGGGIAQISSTTFLAVINSTISGNSAAQNGGGIYLARELISLFNSTITNNSATQGGGLYIASLSPANISRATICAHSIIAGQSSGGDCGGVIGTFVSLGYNIESSTSCGFTSLGDQQNVNSLSLSLGSLQDNGGPTFTHALGSNSVAIDAGNTLCGQVQDQRGEPRPVDVSPPNPPARCDIGSYEVQ